MNQFGDLRSLNLPQEEAVRQILSSWEGRKLYGFNWDESKLLQELRANSHYSLVVAGQLRVLITYKEIFPEAEINFVLKRYKAPSEEAQKALTHLIDNRRQITKWWLEVHEKNLAAQKIYLKVGFEQVSIRKNYYPDGGSALIYCINRDKLFKS